MKPDNIRWIDRNEYPFTSHYFTIDGHRMHYIDEGQGDVLLFVHGTPEWSFAWRHLIKSFSSNYRCVAIDHLGMGLSDKPDDGSYTCVSHAARLEKFIEHLNLKDITLVCYDFGGSISLSYAIHHPENIKRVVLFNTWMWSLKDDKHYSTPAKLMNTWLGKLLYLQFGFSVNVLMPAAYGDKKKLTSEIHRHYKMALPTARERTATYAFAKEMTYANDWWQSLWGIIDVIAEKPFLVMWGMKDSLVPPKELEKWQGALKNANIIKLENTGHFVHEESHEEVVQAMKKWIKEGKRITA